MGWALTKGSLATLRRDRSLAAFPVLAGLAVLCLGTAFGLPAALLLRDDVSAAGIVLAAIGLYAVTFAGVFFSVALAAAAAQVLDGEDATVASGLAVARRRVPQIAGWAGVLASVNLVIQAIQSRTGGLADLLLGGIAVAWGLVTFLAVPVIAMEGLGPWATLKRSASIFRSRWGEQVTGQFSIGLIVFLVIGLPAIVVLAIGWILTRGGVAGDAIGGLLIAIGIAGLLVMLVASACLSQIFGVALYRYATDGRASGPFTAQELEGAVGRRRLSGSI
jgi:hypothetical protein